MRGLVIQSQWLELILGGEKTWELRSTATSIRGQIALIKKGTGQVFGVANIISIRGPLSEQSLLQHEKQHCVPTDFWQPYEDFKWRYAWQLDGVEVLHTPVTYTHPNGAVIWVNLDKPTSEKILANTSGYQPSSLDMSFTQKIDVDETSFDDSIESVNVHPEVVINERLSRESGSTSDIHEVREIVLTQGNINNGHFYLREITDWLPQEVIGGSNRASKAPESMTIDWGGGEKAVSDVAGDKMIFRSRGWVKSFFSLFNLKAGDVIYLSKNGGNNLKLRPSKE